MTEPTSLSTPQSANASDAPLSENLQPVKNEDSWLSEIPLFTPSGQKNIQVKAEPSCTEPSSCENNQNENEQIVEGKFEYEFSCLFNGAICFVHLFDTSDVSACERVIHRTVKPEEITYSPTTGNGFITDAPFKFTFIKEPYKRTWTTHADIKAGVQYENTIARRTPKHVKTAEEILSSF